MQLANDECSEDHTSGKNGEGACITFNKDKPMKWATRVQSFNCLDGTRICWQTMSCPLRTKSPFGATYESTLSLAGRVHKLYGEGFEIGEDSAYTSPISLCDLHTKLKWNAYGTVSWNRYGIPQGEVDGAESSEVSPGAVRGACKAWVATAKVGAARVPLCYQLMQDNKLVRFLSTMHTPSNPSDSNGDMKARWNKVTREYMEVYIPAVKLSYDFGKVGCDLFDQFMALIATEYKTYHIWTAHLIWLWQGTLVNAHLHHCSKASLMCFDDPEV